VRLDGLPTGELAFLLLAYVVLALLAITVVFGVLTLLLRARSQRRARLWAQMEAKWDPVILDVLEGTSDPSDLLERVEHGEGLRFLDYLLSYLRRIRGDEVARLGHLARPFLPLLSERTRQGGVEHRARAVQVLGLLGLPEHAQVVREALDDPAPLVSMIAAQALAKSGLPEATELILERLHRYSDWHVSHLSRLLTEGGAEALPRLREVLGSGDRPAWVRSVVARGLADLRDPESADIAAGIVSSGESVDLVVACLRILAEVGEGRHRDALVPLLEAPDFPVRSHALKALRTVGSAQDLDRFLDALDDESPWVALEAARGLRDVGALEPLRKLAESATSRSSVASQVLSE
jgi:HEAT repeat protein